MNLAFFLQVGQLCGSEITTMSPVRPCKDKNSSLQEPAASNGYLARCDMSCKVSSALLDRFCFESGCIHIMAEQGEFPTMRSLLILESACRLAIDGCG